MTRRRAPQGRRPRLARLRGMGRSPLDLLRGEPAFADSTRGLQGPEPAQPPETGARLARRGPERASEHDARTQAGADHPRPTLLAAQPQTVGVRKNGRLQQPKCLAAMAVVCGDVSGPLTAICRAPRGRDPARRRAQAAALWRAAARAIAGNSRSSGSSLVVCVCGGGALQFSPTSVHRGTGWVSFLPEATELQCHSHDGRAVYARQARTDGSRTSLSRRTACRSRRREQVGRRTQTAGRSAAGAAAACDGDGGPAGRPRTATAQRLGQIALDLRRRHRGSRAALDAAQRFEPLDLDLAETHLR